MNWKDYKSQAERTLSSQFNCDIDDQKVLHSIIGMMTEIDELLENYDSKMDEINKIEEISDFIWYFSILSRMYSIDLPIHDKTIKYISKDFINEKELVYSILKKCLKLLDMQKKKFFYNKHINIENFLEIVSDISHLLLIYTNVNNIDLEKSMEININKLYKRYPDKFSSDKAINRDLETERKILEGKPVEIIDEGISPSDGLLYLDGMTINKRADTTSHYLD
jgi:NTP pyrophosphatase (non-canonical NTP hydrolase)